MRRVVIAFLFAFAASGGVVAQSIVAPAVQHAPMTKAEAWATVNEIARELEANYVYPEIGARYAAVLRSRLAGGQYDGLADPTLFAKRVTDDLQAVAADKHLRVFPPGAQTPFTGRTGGAAAKSVEAAEWISDGVAYIRFNLLSRDPETMTAIEQFMAGHADARTLIIDARNTRGGGLPPIDAIVRYLYAKPTPLLHMDARVAADLAGRFPFPEGATLRRLTSPDRIVRREHHVMPHPTEKRLFDAKVYYLTSARTASAAEHLALVFKRTGRATLVGETTRGAGHFGSVPSIGQRFSMFVPIGRTFDPDTGRDWEGKGIAPDIAVPADRALEEALKHAGVSNAAIIAAAAAEPTRSRM